MEDSAQYGDVGVDTLGHIAEYAESLEIPNLRKLGMANLHPMKQNAPVDRPMGKYMKMREKSCGKDTMTGHWEMMGLHITKPFQTFTDTGFPKELIDELGDLIFYNPMVKGYEIRERLAAGNVVAKAE